MRIGRKNKRVWYGIVGLFVATFLFGFLTAKFKDNNMADAANLGNFDAGYIISDYQMSNYNSMSESEIQRFLKSKGNCNDTRTYLADYYTSYSYHIKDGHFVCLADETFGNGTAYGNDAPYGESAAHIIWQAARDYQINPQVLIVLLQKEQGLITDSWPNNRQYRSATGYGCPDTAPCNSEYYGFKNQVRKAAALFRTVLNGGWTNYPLGWNYIQYNPDSDCGGSWVNVRSLATSALYRYTPYQPNSSALAAGYGSGDSCGAYGNRNFYLYFEDWFGGITENTVVVEEMKSPRIMTIKQSTLVIDAEKIATTGEWLNDNENYYFTKKISVFWGGERQTCLQREEDVGTSKCVLMARMSEFSLDVSIDRFDKTRRYEVTKWTCEVIVPSFWAACGELSHDKGYSFYSDGVVTVSNKKYLKMTNSNNLMLLSKAKRKIYYETVGPVLMKLVGNTYKYDLENRKIQRLDMGQYSLIKVMDKINIDGRYYYRTVVDHNSENDYLILANFLSDDIFDDFLFPRNLVTKVDTYAVNLDTGAKCSRKKKNTVVRYSKKVLYNGTVYFQSDNDRGTNCAVSSAYLDEAVYNFKNLGVVKQFVNFMNPRELVAREDVYMVNLVDGTTCEQFLRQGDLRRYETKVDVDGVVFYRSEDETKEQSPCAVPASSLLEVN